MMLPLILQIEVEMVHFATAHHNLDLKIRFIALEYVLFSNTVMIDMPLLHAMCDRNNVKSQLGDATTSSICALKRFESNAVDHGTKSVSGGKAASN
jgi:hypothetical protein